MSSATYSAGFHGAVTRIRTPHAHDVLSGRGGGINGHQGNIEFRKFVAVRKNDYNLAQNKAEKARVAREVIAVVKALNPPGRFLQKDQTAMTGGAWWVELDDDKMMAKTAQALREGAPQIRAAHREELQERKSHNKKASRRASHLPAVPQVSAYVEPVTQGTGETLLLPAAEERDDVPPTLYEFERPSKRVRVDYNGQTVSPDAETPPLLPSTHTPDVVPLDFFPEPAVMRRSLTRSHSLAHSETSDADYYEFVNPFENDGDDLLGASSPSSFGSAPRPGVLRESSVSSDLGGFGALLDSTKLTFNSDGVRARRSSASKYSSTRSLTSILSDLPESSPQDATDFTEGMKTIHDALHPDVEDDSIPTHMFPFQAPNFRNSVANLIEQQ